MKKWMALLLCLALSVTLIACKKETAETVPAEEETQTNDTFAVQEYDEVGTCGASLQWGYKKATGELVITGSGKMDDYAFDQPAYWDSLVIRSVKIEGAENIGQYAFCESKRLVSVEVSDSVTSIGTSAFESCGELTTINIPSGVTSIGDSAFEHCGSLTDVTIPDGVTYIGYYAFYDCDSLSEVTIPSAVGTVVNHSFSYCNGLTAVTIPANVTAVGAAAFEGCTALTDIHYGGTEEQWAATEIADNDTVPETATVHCNS